MTTIIKRILTFKPCYILGIECDKDETLHKIMILELIKSKFDFSWAQSRTLIQSLKISPN